MWAQERRREHQGLLPAPVLVAQHPSLATWQWRYTNPARWNAYNSLDGGVTWQFDDFTAGSDRQYSPDGGTHFMFIVGVDANGKEITKRSNAIRPDDVMSLVPMTVAGLKLWARLESLAGLQDGDAVATWRDTSGNGRDLVQATTNRQPKLRLESATGLGVLFDGVDDVLATASNVLNTNQHTIFLVARPLATDSVDAIGTGNTASGDLLVMLYSNRLRGHFWRGAASNMTDGSTSLHNGAYVLLEQEVTATDIVLRVNGNVEATQALTGVAAGASKPIYLGSRNTSWCFNGLVRDLLVYEGNPSPADKTRIRDFLMATYRIPTPYPPPPVPGAPFELGAAPDGSDAYLWWDLSEARYATGVEVERKPASAPDSSFAVITVLGLDTEYYDPGIEPQAMTYRLRAFNAGGYSPYSNTATVTF